MLLVRPLSSVAPARNDRAAHLTLLAAIPGTFVARWTQPSVMVWLLIPTIAYSTRAARQFFGSGWVRSLAVVVASYLFFQLAFTAGLVACVLVAVTLA